MTCSWAEEFVVQLNRIESHANSCRELGHAIHLGVYECTCGHLGGVGELSVYIELDDVKHIIGMKNMKTLVPV